MVRIDRGKMTVRAIMSQIMRKPKGSRRLILIGEEMVVIGGTNNEISSVEKVYTYICPLWEYWAKSCHGY